MASELGSVLSKDNPGKGDSSSARSTHLEKGVNCSQTSFIGPFETQVIPPPSLLSFWIGISMTKVSTMHPSLVGFGEGKRPCLQGLQKSQGFTVLHEELMWANPRRALPQQLHHAWQGNKTSRNTKWPAPSKVVICSASESTGNGFGWAVEC